MKAVQATVLILSALLLGGCAPAIVVGGSTGAIVANDERSAGSFIEDAEIEAKIFLQVSEELGQQVNVSATSYNRRVLLVGQVPSEKIRKHVVGIVGGIENVREVLDQMEAGNPSSYVSRASDSALTARVKATLCSLQVAGFSCLDVKVVTEKGIVYLMGIVTDAQSKTAVETVRRVPGVIKVNTLFEQEQ